MADAFAVLGVGRCRFVEQETTADEEGAVGTHCGGFADEFVVGQRQVEKPAQQQQGVGSVAASAAQSGTERAAFFKMDAAAGQCGEEVLQLAVGLHAKVLFGVAADGDARLHKPAMSRLAFGQDFERVAPVDGVEERLKDVVAVFRPTTAHEQADVYFRVGECNFLVFHNRM